MSQENVEIVKGFLPAPDVNIVSLVRDDEMWLPLVDARSPFVHADYESAIKGLPDGDKTYFGLDGERALWLGWLAPWASYRVGAEEYVDLGERGSARSYAFGRSEASTAAGQAHARRYLDNPRWKARPRRLLHQPRRSP